MYQDSKNKNFKIYMKPLQKNPKKKRLVGYTKISPAEMFFDFMYLLIMLLYKKKNKPCSIKGSHRFIKRGGNRECMECNISWSMLSVIVCMEGR